MLQHIQMHAHAHGTGAITPKTGEELENIRKIIRPAASEGKGRLRMIRGPGDCPNGLFEGRFRTESLTHEDHRRPETVDCRPWTWRIHPSPSASSRTAPTDDTAANVARAERLVRDAARARRADHLPQGAVQRALLLQVAAVRPLRPRRADSRTDDRADAGAGARARGRPHRADLRAAGGRRLSQLRRGHRCGRHRCSACIARCTSPTIRCSTRSTTSRPATDTSITTASMPGEANGFRVWKTRYATIGVLICWDQWYPEAARITSLLGAEMLFYPTAIGWHPGRERRMGRGAGRRVAHDAARARDRQRRLRRVAEPRSATRTSRAPTASSSSAIRSSPIRSAASSPKRDENEEIADRAVRPGAHRRPSGATGRSCATGASTRTRRS